jgi:DNA replication protein DnaC/primosomal protein DnaI
MKSEHGLLTLEIARRLELTYEPPPQKNCEYCGAARVPLGVKDSKGFVRWVTYEACGCEGEVAAVLAQAARETRRRTEEARARLMRSGIPKRYIEANITHPESKKFVEGDLGSTDRGLYIYGGVGTGKTSEACAVAKAAIYADKRVVVTTTLAMLNDINKGYGTSGGHDIAHFTGATLLVLDDIGKENANAWAQTTMFEVVNKRYENMLPTVYTSQYTFAELEKRMARSGEGESAKAIVSRIIQTSEVINLGNIDKRRMR